MKKLTHKQLDGLRPLLNSQPMARVILVGDDKRTRAVCIACGGQHKSLIIPDDKHTKDCSYQAHFRAVAALYAILKQNGLAVGPGATTYWKTATKKEKKKK